MQVRISKGSLQDKMIMQYNTRGGGGVRNWKYRGNNMMTNVGKGDEAKNKKNQKE